MTIQEVQRLYASLSLEDQKLVANLIAALTDAESKRQQQHDSQPEVEDS